MQVVLTEHHLLENISFRDTTIAGKGFRTAFEPRGVPALTQELGFRGLVGRTVPSSHCKPAMFTADIYSATQRNRQ